MLLSHHIIRFYCFSQLWSLLIFVLCKGILQITTETKTVQQEHFHGLRYCNCVTVPASPAGKARVVLTGQCSADWLNTMKPPCSKRSSWTGVTPGKHPAPQKTATTTSLIRRYQKVLLYHKSIPVLCVAHSCRLLLRFTLILMPGAVHLWSAPCVRCLPDAAPPSSASLHQTGRVQCGEGLRPGGGRGVAELRGQHTGGGGMAHPGVWLQSPTRPEHRPVPWGRHLRGEVEVHGQHCGSVLSSCVIHGIFSYFIFILHSCHHTHLRIPLLHVVFSLSLCYLLMIISVFNNTCCVLKGGGFLTYWHKKMQNIISSWKVIFSSNLRKLHIFFVS